MAKYDNVEIGSADLNKLIEQEKNGKTQEWEVIKESEKLRVYKNVRSICFD